MAEKKSTYNATKYKNNRAYDTKTYKAINLRLRYDEDGDVIDAFSEGRKCGIQNRQMVAEWFRHGGNAKTANNGGHTIKSDVLPILDTLTGVKPENEARAAEIAEKVQSDLRYKNIVRELTESEV